MLQIPLTEAQVIDVNRIVVPPSHILDVEIIKRIKDGDIDAYGSIMRRYNPRIYRIARSIVIDDAAAMDVVQEAHIKAYYKLDEFRGPTGFLTWLATITRHEALMYLRKHKREVSMENDNQPFENTDANGSFGHSSSNLPDEIIQNKQLKKMINSNIDRLPDIFRSVFVLRAVEQFTAKETSQILGIKEETVKTRYCRAKRLLRGQIQTYLDAIGMTVYEFGGHHCNLMIHNVIAQIRYKSQSNDQKFD